MRVKGTELPTQEDTTAMFLPAHAAKLIGRRWLPFVIVLVVALGVTLLGVMNMRLLYRATSMIAIADITPSSIASLFGVQLGSQGSSSFQGETYTRLVNSESFHDRLSGFISRRDSLSIDSEEMGEYLYAEFKPPEVLMLHGTHQVPSIARDLANYTAMLLLEENRSFIRGEISSLRDFLETESNQALQAVHGCIEERRRFIEANGLIDAELQRTFRILAEIQLEHLGNLRALHAAEVQWDETRSVFRSDSVLRAYAVVSDPVIRRLDAVLNEKLAEYAIGTVQTSGNRPDLEALAVEIDRIRAELGRKYSELLAQVEYSNAQIDSLFLRDYLLLSSKIISLRSLVSDLAGDISRLKSEIDNLSIQTHYLEQYEIKLTMATERYNTLESYYQRARMEIERARSNLSLLAEASLPGRPRWNRSLFFTFGVFASLVVAFGSVVVIDALDDSIRTFEDAAKLSPFFTFGLIQHVRSSQPGRIDTADDTSSLSRDFENIFTSLEFSRKVSPFDRLMVTSCTTGEGKSFVGLNLALKASRLGLKTALVELDVVRPSLSAYLGLTPESTLNDLLLDKCSLNQALNHSVNPNLSILFADEYRYNYIELFRDEKISTILAEIKRENDLVIIDTMPLLQAYETSSILNLTEAAVVVGRSGVSRRGQLMELSNIFEKSPVRVLGMILNDVRSRKSGYNYNYKPKHPV